MQKAKGEKNMKKAIKQIAEKIKKFKKVIIRIIVRLLLFAVLVTCGILHNNYYNRHLYADRKVVEFPYELVEELPEEPDWYKENAFYKAQRDFYDESSVTTKINKWLRETYYEQGMYVVNKTGEPIPLKNLSFQIGLTFYQNEGNLVVIYDVLGDQLMRMELYEVPIENKNQSCIGFIEEIVNNRYNYCVDVSDNNSLYYYINDGEHNMLKMAEGVKIVDGYCSSESHAQFPLYEKDGQIYTYVIFNSKDTQSLNYEYQIEGSNIQKQEINIAELNGTCVVEEKGMGVIQYNKDGISTINIWLSDEVPAGEYDIQKYFPLLKAYIETKTPKQTKYLLVNHQEGYDDDELW